MESLLSSSDIERVNGGKVTIEDDDILEALFEPDDDDEEKIEGFEDLDSESFLGLSDED